MLLTLVAAGCLAGAFWFPLLRAEFILELPAWVPGPLSAALRDWLVSRGRIPIGEHYLGGIINRLFAAREYFVAGALLLFSIMFPMTKIALGGALGAAGHHFAAPRRDALLHALAVSGKWSMADVFVVALVIVFFKAEGLHFSFTPELGIYCYAAAAVSSSVAVGLVGRDVRSRQPSAGWDDRPPADTMSKYQ